MSIDVLLVKELLDKYEIVGTYNSTGQNIDSTFIRINASRNTILIVKDLLASGKKIYVSKTIEHEILPTDLVIEEQSSLDCKKNIALHDINNLMQQNVLAVGIIDAFDYLTSYMGLLAGGIFICDENREDKYFEVIEKSQENKKPDDLDENASFEEQQDYFDKQNKYVISQRNLQYLEKYLNSFDKIKKISFINDLLNDAKNKVLNANEEKTVDDTIQEYKDKLNMYLHTADLLKKS